MYYLGDYKINARMRKVLQNLIDNAINECNKNYCRLTYLNIVLANKMQHKTLQPVLKIANIRHYSVVLKRKGCRKISRWLLQSKVVLKRKGISTKAWQHFHEFVLFIKDKKAIAVGSRNPEELK